MRLLSFIPIAEGLENAGLVWVPEIGDEIMGRGNRESVSILVDPQGMTPGTLRSTYIWLPSVEQLIEQVEARQAILFHAGLDLTDTSVGYKTILQSPVLHIEKKADSLRDSLGLALQDLLIGKPTGDYH